jgi:hypothetical protein
MGENGEVRWVKSHMEIRSSGGVPIFEAFSSVIPAIPEPPYRSISCLQKNPKNN